MSAVVEHRSSWRSIWQGSWDWELIAAFGDDGSRQTRMVLSCAIYKNWLALGTSYDNEHGEIEIWDLEYDTVVRRMGDDYVSCLEWLRPAVLIAAGREGIVRIWDTDFAEELVMYDMRQCGLPRNLHSFQNVFAIAGFTKVMIGHLPTHLYPPLFDENNQECIRRPRPEEEEPPVPIEKEAILLDFELNQHEQKEIGCVLCFVSSMRLFVLLPNWHLLVYALINTHATNHFTWQRTLQKSLHSIHAIPDAFGSGFLRTQPRLLLISTGDDGQVLIHGGRSLEILNIHNLESVAIFAEHELNREREIKDDPTLTFCSVAIGNRLFPFDDLAQSTVSFFPSQNIQIKSINTIFAVVGNSVHRGYETTTVRTVYAFSLDEPNEAAQILLSRRVHKQLRQAQLEKERKVAKQLAQKQRLSRLDEDDEDDDSDVNDDDKEDNSEDDDSDESEEVEEEEAATPSDAQLTALINEKEENTNENRPHKIIEKTITRIQNGTKDKGMIPEPMVEESEHSDDSEPSELSEQDLLTQCARVLVKRRRSMRHIFFRRTSTVRRRPGQAQLIAIDDSGLLWQTTTKFNTSWPGRHFPLGFELVEDNTVYQEREDEFDFMHGRLCVPAEAHDLVAVDGYFGPTYDHLEMNEFQKIDKNYLSDMLDVITPSYSVQPDSMIPRLPSLSSDRRRRAKQASLIQTYRHLFGVSQALFAQHDPLVDDLDDDDLDDRRFFTSLDDDILLSSEDEEDEKSASDVEQSQLRRRGGSGAHSIAETAAQLDDDDDDAGGITSGGSGVDDDELDDDDDDEEDDSMEDEGGAERSEDGREIGAGSSLLSK